MSGELIGIMSVGVATLGVGGGLAVFIHRVTRDINARIDTTAMDIREEAREASSAVGQKIERLEKRIDTTALGIREEAREAHRAIGRNIERLEERLEGRIGAVESRLGNQLDAMTGRFATVEDRIATVESKIDTLTGYVRGYFKQELP